MMIGDEHWRTVWEPF